MFSVLASMEFAPAYAQTGMELAPLAKAIAELGSTFLLGWYLWYTAGKALPKKDELHALTLKEQQVTHTAALKTQQEAYNSATEQARKDFLNELATCRADYREDIQRLVLSMKDLAESIANSHAFHISPLIQQAHRQAEIEAARKNPGGS